MARLTWGLMLWPLALVPFLHDPTPVLDSGTTVPVSDTTYGDDRYVALVPGIVDTHVVGTDSYIRSPRPDPDSVGSGNAWRAVRQPGGTDFLVISYDTLPGEALDSAAVDSIWSDWGLGTPYPYIVQVPGEPTVYSLAWSSASGLTDTTALDGDSVSGTIYVFADTAGTGTVDSVMWFHADTAVNTDATAPWQFAAGGWNTAAYANGSHTIRADLYPDSQVQEATFTIDNASGSTDYPNEPAGYTAFAELSFATKPSEGAQWTDAISGEWQLDEDAGRFDIVYDAAAPSSPDSVARITFPTGWNDGVGPIQFTGWETLVTAASRTQYRKVYLSMWFKIHGPTYENQSTGTKFGFMNYGDLSRTNVSVPFIDDACGTSAGTPCIDDGPWTLVWHFTTLLGDPAGGSWRYPNKGTYYRIQPDTWHQLEAVFIRNTDGANDGDFYAWLDGVLWHEHHNIRFKDSASGYGGGFFGYNFDPTWGGDAGEVKTQDDYISIDHVYLSGVPE